MRERLRVEVEWLVNLSMLGLAELPRLPREAESRLRQLVSDFSIEDCTEIKAIEAETNHDVKARRVLHQRRTQDLPALAPCVRVHPLRVYVRGHQQRRPCVDARARSLRAAGRLRNIHAQLREYAHGYADLPMLSRTHGQPASPTTVGKEFANVTVRLAAAIDAIARVPLLAKMNGAVGNYNAHLSGLPGG